MQKQVSMAGQYLSFQISGDEYAVPVLKVREIIEYNELTRIPQAPPAVRGVINLRGNVVPVIDLAKKFGFAEANVTRWTCIVVLEVLQDNEIAVLGVLCDAVSQVIDLTDDLIEPPPEFGLEGRLDYLLGMGKSDKKFLLLIDTDKVLSHMELRKIATAMEQTGQTSHENQAEAMV